MSPLTNERTDEYGGSLENRYLFAKEIIEQIRGSFKGSLWIRLSLTAYDDSEKQNSLDDWKTIGKWLEKDGIDFGDMQCYEHGEEIYNAAVEQGKMSAEVRDQQLAAIIPYYKNFSKEQMNDVVKIDSSLAAMQFMLVARAHGYDTNPIGGFEADQLAEVVDLDKERYVPVMILSIGKAMEKGYESVRFAPEKITNFK